MSEGTVKSMLASAAPIAANDSASLWDFGSGVACFEVHTKMNALDVQALELLESTIARAGSAFGALVIGNDDARAFSVGADLAYNHAMVVNEDWTALSTYFKKGQDLYQTLAAMSVPVVAAAHGFALLLQLPRKASLAWVAPTTLRTTTIAIRPPLRSGRASCVITSRKSRTPCA